MKKTALLLTVALLALAAPARAADNAPIPIAGGISATSATVANGFTDAQKTEIEDIIKDYLVNKHPEVMAEGLQGLQKREQENADAKTKAEINSAKDRVYNNPASPVGGNAKGNVTVVEFFDYQCGYCKMSEDGVEKLLKDDKNVKFIYKDFPILGNASVEAAKAALASVKQGKYIAFHDALMSKKEHLTSEMIYQIAKDKGLDVEKLKKDMADQAITDQITDNLKLGQDIGVQGTPMFVINDNVYPGALQYEQLKKAVDEARDTAKKS